MSSITGRDAIRTGAKVLFVAVLGLMLVVVVPQVVGADHSYVVVSGSMAPTLSPGDVVLVEETSPAAITAGDIITYERDGTRTTHRVVEVVPREEGPHFRTQGDANEEVDQQLVAPDHLLGRVMVSIPYVGYFLSFARTDAGILTLVILPATLLIASEVWTLIQAARTNETADTEDGDTPPARLSEDD